MYIYIYIYIYIDIDIDIDIEDIDITHKTIRRKSFLRKMLNKLRELTR